ncbi:MAG: hypothetical protein HYX96_03585 [Chloroflexi bacterium]|nr:hypothetical protein [Chloroflexota bacterium]
MSGELKQGIIIVGLFLITVLGLGIIAGIFAFLFGAIELLKTDAFIYGGVIGIIIGVLATFFIVWFRNRSS